MENLPIIKKGKNRVLIGHKSELWLIFLFLFIFLFFKFYLFFCFVLNFYFYFILLYNTVLVLPYIDIKHCTLQVKKGFPCQCWFSFHE